MLCPCYLVVSTHTVLQTQLLPPQSSQLHEVNKNKLQCKYVFVMSFNNRISLLCYRHTGGGHKKRSRWERRCAGISYLFFPGDWIQFSCFHLIKTQRIKLCDACRVCKHIMITSRSVSLQTTTSALLLPSFFLKPHREICTLLFNLTEDLRSGVLSM